VIHVTYDGDTYWLECFADDPDAENGRIVHPISAGDPWGDLVAKVAAHRAEHGCGSETAPAGEGSG
jgi:hypothetical protein